MNAVTHRTKHWVTREIPLLLVAFSLLVCAKVSAGGSIENQDPTIKIPIHKSKNVSMDQPVKRVSIANPKIADILIISKDEIYVVGKKLGTTNVMIWDENDDIIDVYNLEVTHDLATLRKRIHQYLPDEKIGIESSQGHLVLSGEASSTEKMAMAVKFAEGYATAAGSGKSGSQVLNMMSVGGGHQVMLEVTVAEVQSEVARRLDSKMLLAVDGSDGTIGITSGSDFLSSLGLTQGIDRGLFGSYLDGDLLLNFALDIAKQNGLAKILAEPNITALSGQQADFLSGGEFPIPVPNRDGITIQYRDFGVGVSFVPTILDSGKINLNLQVLVSELSSTNTVAISPDETNTSLVIPSIIKRTTSTTVELGDGQTIAIGGLISDNFRESVNKIPGLGDIPVLGQLFRSQEFIKGQSELVIMVTPRLVRPFNREGIKLPTDGFVEPGDMDFYLLGRTSSRPINETNESNPNTSGDTSNHSSELLLDDGGTSATYGHEISTNEFQE
ncbi:type II and III secretion system protein family protein [Thalassotalea sp. PS06]|uniref:type II and III secretion system protein family protein n=1 Tax=Thalassotalea sp. PS06 TaxID=2594005 RepID=UPI001163A7D1|nr:type II and III secretion system protein family protein [Thalassotalea sp. PS06]QDP02066.1 type II and III secretion system protein family protein [Thalassotalea sp. PS06]